MNWTPASLFIGAALSLITASAGAAPPKPKISWNPCYRDFGPFECGTVQVPLDHSHPSGEAISIAMVRLPAADPSRRIGSLFLNPGGPGGSGFIFALVGAPILFTDEVRARFDIVGFDPRGIASSTALRCFGNPRQWSPYFTPFAFPTTSEEEVAWEAADRFLVDQCDQRGSRIIDHMSTADVARDLDLLRQAVGDEQLSYAGYSYGSYLGVTYANLFPDKVRAMVVDGVIDPIAWATGVPGEGAGVPVTTRLRSDAGAQSTLNEFFRLCDSGGPNCAFGGNSASRFAALAAKLRAEPVVIPLPDGTTIVFNYSLLIANALGAMYDSFSWPSFAQFLSALESAASPATLGERLSAMWQSQGFITKRGFPHYPNFIEGFPAVMCADSDNPDSYAAWSTASAAAEAQYGYFGPIWTWASSLCAAWPGDQGSRYPGPFNRSTANPVLVATSLFDPATRYEGAVTVAGLLPSSRLLTVAGWGHTTLFLSQGANQAIARYLVDVQLPPSGAVYQQDLVPFTQPAAVVAASAASAGRARVMPAMVPEVLRRLHRGRSEGVAALGTTPQTESPLHASIAGEDASLDVTPPQPREALSGLPSNFELRHNYPNPFNGRTTFSFAVPERSQVRLSVFTLLGQEVATLVDGELAPGYRSIQWKAVDNKGRALSPGVYMYRMRAKSLTTGEFHRAGKMILVR